MTYSLIVVKNRRSRTSLFISDPSVQLEPASYILVSYFKLLTRMSQNDRAQTKNSSQVPRTRAAPQGSTGSAPRLDQQSDSQDQNQAEIPSEAITSSTSRPQKTFPPQQEGRRQSNVQFAPAPSLAPSDSISRIKTRSTWPGPNSNSDRQGSRNSRTPWKSYGSQVTRTSSQNGTAWSGSGAALTENNLEKLNEATGKGRSDGNSNQERQSDQQEVPQSAQRSSRQNGNATNGDGARSRGTQQTARRSSRQYGESQNYNSGSQGVASQGLRSTTGVNNQGSSGNAGDVSREVTSASQSKQQSAAASKNVIDINPAPSGARRSSGGSKSNGASKSQCQSRRDSMLQGEEADAAATSNEVNKETQSAQTGQRSGTAARSKRDSVSKPQSAGSPTSPTRPGLPNGWEKKVRTITKRYPDGREVTEKEITVQPVGAG